MKYLYIDTSSNYLYSAITEDNKVISEIKKEYSQNLSEMAMPEIASLFKNNNILPKDIGKIIVVNGPGSFTGVRIGITIAKVYAWSLNIPITTISSLEAMSISHSSKNIKVPILNARRGYVYTAIYKDSNILLEPQYIKFEKLKEILNKYDNYDFISNDSFEEDIHCFKYSPKFENIIETYKNRKCINPHLVNPEYLKLTEAEESKK